MSKAKEYFQFIEKLENDPKFCFMVIETGEVLLSYDKNVEFADFFRSVTSYKIDWKQFCSEIKEIRDQFVIKDENHPTYKQCIKTISKDAKWSLIYAYFAKKRFEMAEPIIAENASYSYYYAVNVIKDRFELGEKAIATNVSFSIDYAAKILDGKFELAEPEISKTSDYSFEYAKKVVGRFELGEPAIARNPRLSYEYAVDILRGRFELGEDAMMRDENIMLQYAQNVMKGKLPEKMHNAMLLLTYENQAA